MNDVIDFYVFNTRFKSSASITKKAIYFVAFDKERLHSAVLIENFGLSIHGHQFGPPEKFSGAKLFRANDVISIEHVRCSQQESSFTFSLSSFDLLFAFSVLSFKFWTVLSCLFMFTKRSPMLSDVNCGNSCI